jgi:hypothetical protein
MATTPKFNVGDITYLRSSSLLGFVEEVKIASVQSHNGSWLYSIVANNSQPTPGSYYGDRKSIIDSSILYFDEAEFTTLCAAFQNVKSHLEDRLTKVNEAIERHCT